MFRALCYISCFAFLVAGYVQAQNEDYDEEKDNEFPLENQEKEHKEGSGNGLNLFDELPPIIPNVEEFPNEMVNSDAILCPDACTCSQESSSDGDQKIVIDCSSKSLAELPQNIDHRVTELLFQENKLEVVPKEISDYKDLQIVNLNDNKIKDFDYGSISELPRLRLLKLANNRLLDIPRDLKNGIELNQLQELDLSGNDIRETIEASSFEHMQNLKALILPSTNSKLVADICHSHQYLDHVCTVNCEESSDDCDSIGDNNTIVDSSTIETLAINASDVPVIGDLNETPIEVSPFQHLLEDTNESVVTESNVEENEVENTTEPVMSKLPEGNSFVSTTEINEPSSTNGENIVNKEVEDTTESGVSILPSESSRAVNSNASSETDGASDNLTASAEAAKDKSVSQQAGVDNRIIAGVIAGMVLVVAGVAIKKNWTTIRNKLRPRPIPSYSGQQANGASPEETPLKSTSPA